MIDAHDPGRITIDAVQPCHEIGLELHRLGPELHEVEPELHEVGPELLDVEL